MDQRKAHQGGLFPRAEKAVNSVLAWISAGLLFLIMSVTLTDVGGRTLLNRPLIGATELASGMLVIMVFLSLTFGEEHGKHIRVELLTGRLPSQARDICNLAVFLLVFLFLGVLTWYSGLKALESLLTGEHDLGSLHLKLYPVRFMLTIGYGIFALCFLSKAVALTSIFLKKEQR